MKKISQELCDRGNFYYQGHIFTERILFEGCAVRFLKTSWSIQQKIEYATTLFGEMEKDGFNAQYIEDIFKNAKKVWNLISTMQEDFLSFLVKAEYVGKAQYGEEAYLRLNKFMKDMRETLADFTIVGEEKRKKYNSIKANFAIYVSKLPQLREIAEIISHKALYTNYPLSMREIKNGEICMLFEILQEQNSLIGKALLELKGIQEKINENQERREA